MNNIEVNPMPKTGVAIDNTPKRIYEITCRVKGANERIQAARGRVSDKANQLVGLSPEVNSSDENDMPSNGELSELENSLTILEDNTNRLFGEIDRLDLV